MEKPFKVWEQISQGKVISMMKYKFGDFFLMTRWSILEQLTSVPYSDQHCHLMYVIHSYNVIKDLVQLSGVNVLKSSVKI
jgi:hypothetical protein